MFRICLIIFILSCSLECRLTPQVVVIDADTGAVLFQKHAHKKTYCASCTKIATALYVLSKNPPKGLPLQVLPESLKISKKENKMKTHRFSRPYVLENDGVMQGLRIGQTESLTHFLSSMLIGSCNDSANVIAQNIGGTIPKFMHHMNLFLKNIGCKNTHFMNPHGLHHPSHKTTAYDLAQIAKHALQYPEFARLTQTKSITLPFKASRLKNTNKLLHPGKYHYKYAKGMKTGYTENARYCLVASADNGKRKLIAVLLNAPSSGARYVDAIELFERFLNEKPQKQPLFIKKQFCYKHKIQNKDCLVGIAEDIHALHYPSDTSQTKIIPHFTVNRLPIIKGQALGSLDVYLGEKKLETVPLIALDDVHQMLSWKSWGLVFFMSFIILLCLILKRIKSNPSR